MLGQGVSPAQHIIEFDSLLGPPGEEALVVKEVVEKGLKEQSLAVDFEKGVSKLLQVGHLFQTGSPALIQQLRDELVDGGIGVFLQTDP